MKHIIRKKNVTFNYVVWFSRWEIIFLSFIGWTPFNYSANQVLLNQFTVNSSFIKIGDGIFKGLSYMEYKCLYNYFEIEF